MWWRRWVNLRQQASNVLNRAAGTPPACDFFTQYPVVSLVPRSSTGYWLASLRDEIPLGCGVFGAGDPRTPPRLSSLRDEIPLGWPDFTAGHCLCKRRVAVWFVRFPPFL